MKRGRAVDFAMTRALLEHQGDGPRRAHLLVDGIVHIAWQHARTVAHSTFARTTPPGPSPRLAD